MAGSRPELKLLGEAEDFLFLFERTVMLITACEMVGLLPLPAVHPLAFLLFSNASYLFISLRRFYLIPNYLQGPFECEPCDGRRRKHNFYKDVFVVERIGMLLCLFGSTDVSVANAGLVATLVSALIGVAGFLGKLVLFLTNLVLLVNVTDHGEGIAKSEERLKSPVESAKTAETKQVRDANNSTQTLFQNSVDACAHDRNIDRLNERNDNFYRFEEIIARQFKSQAKENLAQIKPLIDHNLKLQQKVESAVHAFLADRENLRAKLSQQLEWERERGHFTEKLQVADDSLAVYREDRKLYDKEREHWELEKAALKAAVNQAEAARRFLEDERRKLEEEKAALLEAEEQGYHTPMEEKLEEEYCGPVQEAELLDYYHVHPGEC